MRPGRVLALCVLGILVAASPAPAHHDWPIDRTRLITVKGTVTAYAWANPHVMITLDVDNDGTIERWSIGGSSPQYMTTCGWSKNTVKPGDRLTVVGYRFRDGSHSARVYAVVIPSGREMYYGAPPGQAAQYPPRRDTSPLPPD